MSEFTEEQRIRALELRNAWVTARGGRPVTVQRTKLTRVWLAVEEHVLQSHTCESKWRPTTSAEIQPGWEVRSRSETGTPNSWGIAHHRDEDGDWRTGPEDAVLTYDADGWTYETTAPVPKPNPARIQVVLDWANEPPGPDRHADAVDLLTRLDNLKENTP